MTTLVGDVIRQLAQGTPISVTFRKGIEDCEAYAEPGMKAQLVGARNDRDGVVRLKFDYQPFDAHNRTLESSNYYDKAGVARLNARDAGFYKPIEELYLMAEDPVSKFFDIDVAAGVLELMTEYRASGSEASYVAWLESQLITARSAAR